MLLAVNADDYGYAPAYDRGIIAAAEAGAIDGASVMALRDPDPAPLLAAGVELGLHLEPSANLAAQLGEFERLVGSPPAYLDGHRHCHASGAFAVEVAELAARLGVPVRAVGAEHRTLLRERGVRYAEPVLGRLDQGEAAMPPELAAWLAGGQQPAGVAEWFVHPGRPDPAVGSAYDAGRAEDLALVLELGPPQRWAERGIRRAPLGRSLSV